MFKAGQRLPNLPLYRQMMPGTCGPACIIMILEHRNPDLGADRWTELRIWSKVWALPLGPTDEYGLALFLASQGIGAEVVVDGPPGLRPRSAFLRLAWRLLSPYVALRYSRRREKALRLGVRESMTRIDVDLVKEVLEEDRTPIVMVDQSGYAPGGSLQEGMLHWIVVYGYDEKFLVNDPDMGRISLSREEMELAMDLQRNFGLNRRMVIASIKG